MYWMETMLVLMVFLNEIVENWIVEKDSST